MSPVKPPTFRLKNGATLAFAIMEILDQIAPNEQARKDAGEFYRELRKDWKSNQTEQDRAMVGALYDGMSFGNWPWVLADRKRQVEALLNPSTRIGYVIIVETRDGLAWLGRRVYLNKQGAQIVKANILADNRSGRYRSVTIERASDAHFNTANEVA